MPIAKSNDLSISYDDLGSGDAGLLILTGWCDNRKQFDPLANILSRDFRVLSMDWRGHGKSEAPKSDFSYSELVSDAEAVISDSRLKRVVVVAASHAGWVSIELKRRLPEVVESLIWIDWIVGEAPPEFLGALGVLQTNEWASVRDKLFAMWTDNAPPVVSDFVRTEMAGYGQEMWARAGREIQSAYRHHTSPLHALKRFGSVFPVMHLYAQPKDPNYLEFQKKFSREWPLFFPVNMDKLNSHFPSLESPELCALQIKTFFEKFTLYDKLAIKP